LPRTQNHQLQATGVDGYVLDLRSNPGGLVQSAADVARVFMDGHPTLFTVSGRSGEQLQEVVLEDGSSETTAPLTVLVDHGSASASEILSGALRDNHRALVIGDEKTYGKGRIQSVYEMVGALQGLSDGPQLTWCGCARAGPERQRTPGGARPSLARCHLAPMTWY
jgi:C-terminal peptidase prc